MKKLAIEASFKLKSASITVPVKTQNKMTSRPKLADRMELTRPQEVCAEEKYVSLAIISQSYCLEK